ncbi:MAG: hypothetical protein EHM40_03335 [Chloroflexi bacterium]|nr:MAG: hypothetical protein EHM40_03335 [Chloroflexota bacterium]
MKQAIKVIEVKEPPQLKSPAIQQGIRDKAAAQNWAEKNGYATVYFMARKQKVYAEKLPVKVGDQAKQLEMAL